MPSHAEEDVLWVMTHDNARLVFVSPAYERVWGRSVESLYADPRSFVDAAHPDDRDGLFAAFANQLQGKPFTHEYRIVRPDGAIRWVWAHGYPVEGQWFIGLAQDITERRRVAERLDLMSRATGEAVWEWDIAAGTAWWSDANYRMYGYDRTVAPSHEAWLARVHPDDRARVNAGFTAAVDGAEGTWTDEYRLLTPDGAVRDVLDRASITRDASGRPARMVGAVVDVTELRRLERQLRHAQKMDAIGQLAGGIAHDFSNMLQAIFFEVALARTHGPSRALEHLDEIHDIARRASGLTRQLLLFSRREQLQARPLDLNDAVSNMARMLHRILGEDIALQIELAPGALGVEGDPGMIDQVLLNLAVNARDAMPAGGTLSIATSSVQHDGGAGRPAGRYACIEVRDTGEGIAAEVLPRIFEPFFTTKARGSGTGLGLATAFGIVEQHRGWIDVDSTPGRGATFLTYLPVVDLARAEAPADLAAAAGHETILLVEDDDAVRGRMRAVLELHGYRVIEAERASAALDAWDRAQGGIDLVLTDFVMPGGMDGRELATRLAERAPGVKVLYATGYSHVRSSLAPALVLDKPVTAEQLVAAVRDRLDAAS
jgi:two-component system cell cycle sensor histidine kinase/response regulator CckA